MSTQLTPTSTQAKVRWTLTDPKTGRTVEIMLGRPPNRAEEQELARQTFGGKPRTAAAQIQAPRTRGEGTVGGFDPRTADTGQMLEEAMRAPGEMGEAPAPIPGGGIIESMMNRFQGAVQPQTFGADFRMEDILTGPAFAAANPLDTLRMQGEELAGAHKGQAGKAVANITEGTPHPNPELAAQGHTVVQPMEAIMNAILAAVPLAGPIVGGARERALDPESTQGEREVAGGNIFGILGPLLSMFGGKGRPSAPGRPAAPKPRAAAPGGQVADAATAAAERITEPIARTGVTAGPPRLAPGTRPRALTPTEGAAARTKVKIPKKAPKKKSAGLPKAKTSRLELDDGALDTLSDGTKVRWFHEADDALVTLPGGKEVSVFTNSPLPKSIPARIRQEILDVLGGDFGPESILERPGSLTPEQIKAAESSPGVIARRGFNKAIKGPLEADTPIVSGGPPRLAPKVKGKAAGKAKGLAVPDEAARARSELDDIISGTEPKLGPGTVARREAEAKRLTPHVHDESIVDQGPAIGGRYQGGVVDKLPDGTEIRENTIISKGPTKAALNLPPEASITLKKSVLREFTEKYEGKGLPDGVHQFKILDEKAPGLGSPAPGSYDAVVIENGKVVAGVDVIGGNMGTVVASSKGKAGPLYKRIAKNHVRRDFTLTGEGFETLKGQTPKGPEIRAALESSLDDLKPVDIETGEPLTQAQFDEGLKQINSGDDRVYWAEANSILKAVRKKGAKDVAASQAGKVAGAGQVEGAGAAKVRPVKGGPVAKGPEAQAAGQLKVGQSVVLKRGGLHTAESRGVIERIEGGTVVVKAPDGSKVRMPAHEALTGVRRPGERGSVSADLLTGGAASLAEPVMVKVHPDLPEVPLLKSEARLKAGKRPGSRLFFEKALESSIPGSGPFQRVREAQNAAMEALSDAVVKRIHGMGENAYVSGSRAIAAIEDAKEEALIAARDLYTQVDTAAKGVKVPTHTLKIQARALKKEVDQAKRLLPADDFNKADVMLNKILSAPSEVTFAEMSDFRSGLLARSRAIKEAIPDKGGGMVKKLVSEADASMERAAQKSGGDLLSLWREANTQYKATATTFNRTVVAKMLDEIPEKVHLWVAKAPLDEIPTIRSVMPADRWQSIKAHIIRDAIDKAMEGEVDLRTGSKISEGIKDLTFVQPAPGKPPAVLRFRRLQRVFEDKLGKDRMAIIYSREEREAIQALLDTAAVVHARPRDLVGAFINGYIFSEGLQVVGKVQGGRLLEASTEAGGLLVKVGVINAMARVISRPEGAGRLARYMKAVNRANSRMPEKLRFRLPPKNVTPAIASASRALFEITMEEARKLEKELEQ